MKLSKISLSIQILLIIIGFLVGAFFSNLSTKTHIKHSHIKTDKYCKIPHKIIDITHDSYIPTIKEFKITKDAVSGWNLFVTTTNFIFKPQNVNTKHKAGEGHIHLTINGIKAARLYSNWFHIPSLPDGINFIEVTLNSNSHEFFSNNGKIISKKMDVYN